MEPSFYDLGADLFVTIDKKKNKKNPKGFVCVKKCTRTANVKGGRRVRAKTIARFTVEQFKTLIKIKNCVLKDLGEKGCTPQDPTFNNINCTPAATDTASRPTSLCFQKPIPNPPFPYPPTNFLPNSESAEFQHPELNPSDAVDSICSGGDILAASMNLASIPPPQTKHHTTPNRVTEGMETELGLVEDPLHALESAFNWVSEPGRSAKRVKRGGKRGGARCVCNKRERF